MDWSGLSTDVEEVHWGPLHTQDWEPVTMALQALSLVEKAELVQVWASHYAWGANGVCECKMDVESTWISIWHWMDCVSWSLGLFLKPPLGGRLNIKLGDHGTLNTHKCWLILFDHVWGPAWIEMNWNSIWLRVQSHMTSHYIWGFVTTLHAFGGLLGWPWDTFFWALRISWSWLLACVWSGMDNVLSCCLMLIYWHLTLFWVFTTTITKYKTIFFSCCYMDEYTKL